MRRFFLILPAILFYFIGLSISSADSVPMNYAFPDDTHMQMVNQALDQVENSRHHQIAAVTSAIVPRKDTIDFGSELYGAKFDEPRSLSQKGFMAGPFVRYAHRMTTDPNSIINMYGLQAQWADGKFKQPDYEGPSGIKDNTYDIRGIVGKDLYPAAHLRATPYAGFGYRYLKDNSEGLFTTIGPYTFEGYKRYSHYYYLPLGTDFIYQTDRNYSLESNLEYDIVVHGEEDDKIGVIPGFNTLSVGQGVGEGWRASLRLNMYFKYFTGFAEGFFRYWNMPKSSTQVETDSFGDSQGLYEPRNNTEEFGVRLGLEI